MTSGDSSSPGGSPSVTSGDSSPSPSYPSGSGNGPSPMGPKGPSVSSGDGYPAGNNPSGDYPQGSDSSSSGDYPAGNTTKTTHKTSCTPSKHSPPPPLNPPSSYPSPGPTKNITSTGGGSPPANYPDKPSSPDKPSYPDNSTTTYPTDDSPVSSYASSVLSSMMMLLNRTLKIFRQASVRDL